MNDVLSFVLALQRRGVKLWSEGGRVRYRARRGAISEKDIAEIGDRKSDIIELLEQNGEFALAAMEFRQREGYPHDASPLTFQQQWLWSRGQRNAGWRVPCAFALELQGPLDWSLLRRSFEVVTGRHRSLRTRIVVSNGITRQQVDADLRDALAFIRLDLPDLSADEIRAAVQQRVDAFVRAPIGLAAGPLWKGELVALSGSSHVLVLVLDHLIVDQLSINVLIRDLWAAYADLKNGQVLSTTRMPVQYDDFAAWQHQTHASWAAQHLPYWKMRHDGAARIQLPVAERIAVAGPSSALVRINIDRYLTNALRELTRRLGTVLPMSVLTAYSVIVCRWSGATDMVVPFNVMGRYLGALADSIGYFAQVMYLRIQLSPEDALCAVMDRVTREYRMACEHHDGGRIATLLPEFLAGTWFEWAADDTAPAPSQAYERSNSVQALPFPISRATDLSTESDIDVGWNFFETSDGIAGLCRYRVDLFRQSAMERLCLDLESCLKKLVENPQCRASDLALVST